MVATISRFEDYSQTVMNDRYSKIIDNRLEMWDEIAARVTHAVCRTGYVLPKIPSDVEGAIEEAIRERKLIPGGRMLANAGNEYHQTDNCFMLRAEDSREGWADLAHATTMMFMSGGGVGIDYSDLRPFGSPLKKTGGIASGPIPLIQMINAIGAAARQGGERRGAIYASLKWDHPDINDFIWLKSHTKLEHTNISVRFNDDWAELAAEYPRCTLPYNTFLKTLKHACQYGDPGFQFDWDNQILRNACTEVISADPYDSCCLASLNLAKISSLEELATITELGIIFLLAATEYTDVPVPEVKKVKYTNRRLGLGLMGVAEWFLQRGLPYGTIHKDFGAGSDDFSNWMSQYKYYSETSAKSWSDKFNMNTPIATRAIAPTGTISIAGGQTTPGLEPVFHTAYLRTYNKHKERIFDEKIHREVIMEPIVAKWIEEGYDVDHIDTAYTLSQTTEGIERRIKFQSLVQQYVDNGISSTVNLPQYTEGVEDKIAPILLKYLPTLRGITFYPDGAHENQPVVPVDLKDINGAILEHKDPCVDGVCSV